MKNSDIKCEGVFPGGRLSVAGFIMEVNMGKDIGKEQVLELRSVLGDFSPISTRNLFLP